MTDFQTKRKRFALLAVTHSDILAARDGFQAIINGGYSFSDPIYQTLLFGAVISYGKPFSDNRGYGRLGGAVAKLRDASLRAAHEELITLRNKVVAHSDADQVEIFMLPPGCTMTIEDRSVELDEMNYSVKVPGLPESQLPVYVRLCEHREERLITEIAGLKDNLFEPGSYQSRPFRLEL